MMEEAEIEGHPGYFVTSTGQVRGPRGYRKLWLEKNGYYTATIRNKRLKVHRLVAQAFIPNPDNLPLVRHLNDVRGDNRVENLAWGTISDNAYDAVRNGVHPESRKDRCPANHLYSTEGYIRPTTGARVCSVCENARARAKRKGGLPDPNDPRHGTPNGYLNLGCRCGSCREAARDHNRAKRQEKRSAMLVTNAAEDAADKEEATNGND